MATGVASLGGRYAPTQEQQKNINSSASKNTMPLFYSVERTVATERATKGHAKPKSSCLATGIACLGGRSAPTKEHQNIGTDCSDRESYQRTHKPKSSCLATGSIARLGGRSATAKEHQNINSSS